MNQSESLHPLLNRMQRQALLIGLVGVALIGVGAFFNLKQFFHSYLWAYLFWFGIALGCLAILMLQHLAGGRWGFVIRRFLEAGSRLLPLMALLFVPLYFGLHDLYPWSRLEEVASDELLQHKRPYLNTTFFLIRAGIYFVIWIGLMFLMNRWSRQQDRHPEFNWTRHFQFFSAIGLGLYGLTVTFASIDWAMSLEPHWYSTIYGVMFAMGQIVSTFAFVIVALALLADREPFSEMISPDHFHDLGNLLLAFVILWTYMAFSQYLIIWSGNLPEEITWYLHRIESGWVWLPRLLIIFHFAVPFLLLLSRRTKRRSQVLAAVAVGILFFHLIDVFWLVVPAFHHEGFALHWMDIVAPIGLGGIWIAAFIWQLQRWPLLPHGSRLQEAVEHG